MAEKVGSSLAGWQQVTSAGQGDVREKPLEYLLLPDKRACQEKPFPVRLRVLGSPFCGLISGRHGLDCQVAFRMAFSPETPERKKHSLSTS